MDPLPVISFSKDWGEDATCNHHILREMAKTRTVVWLNSISMRRPRFSSVRDRRKIVKKLQAFAKGPVEVERNLWVHTPIVVPAPHSRLAVALNRQLLRSQIRALKGHLGIEAFELWSFIPTVGHYLGAFGESLLVYYCTDEHSLFSYVDQERTARAERPLVERADVVFASSEALADRKRERNPSTYFAAHGVDHELFSRALAADTRVPPDLAAVRPPVVGFYGTLQDWIDLPLISTLAARHPEWSIVLVGQVFADLSSVTRFPNVHLLGRKPHGELPAYCKGFDVAMIPYRLDARMNFVNPVKLREYLSAGRAVVSTAVPEVLRYRQHCAIARSVDEFEAAVARALETDAPHLRQRRSDAMRAESWERKVADLRAIVDRIRAEPGDLPRVGRVVA